MTSPDCDAVHDSMMLGRLNCLKWPPVGLLTCIVWCLTHGCGCIAKVQCSVMILTGPGEGGCFRQATAAAIVTQWLLSTAMYIGLTCTVYMLNTSS